MNSDSPASRLVDDRDGALCAILMEHYDGKHQTVHDRDGALLTVAGVGPAHQCVAYPNSPHRPTPMRYIWHHILPQTCGGKTSKDNLASLCDTCHYNVHTLLVALKQFGGDVATIAHRGTQMQRDLAVLGWNRAVAAGTTGKIPNEGGLVGGHE